MSQFYGIAGAGSTSVTLACDCLAHRFGNAADHGVRARRYPTDMSDTEWAVVRPLLPVPGWLRGRGGQPEAYCHRTMLDAVRYLVDNGTKWRAMPADFPPFLWNLICQHHAYLSSSIVHSRCSAVSGTESP
ncbi:transposase, partial [Kitasatospora sp. NPDC048298]|uniref:transposase n=1 Tax=Kitasatospora sp. NPDC048298 TaxID=3364049 RepID=UPI00371ED9DE